LLLSQLTSKKRSQVGWYMTVLPVTWGPEARGSLEELGASLRSLARPCLKKKILRAGDIVTGGVLV
jgi:hypothetical protein